MVVDVVVWGVVCFLKEALEIKPPPHLFLKYTHLSPIILTGSCLVKELAIPL